MSLKAHKRGKKKKLECICKMCLFEICVRFAVLILSKEKKGACIDGDMHLINIANIFYVPRDMLGARNIWVEV